MQSICIYICYALSVVFFAIRFLHLSADFGLPDWSGDLYTDEGGYTNNAISWVLQGHWFIPGGFNPTVNFPVATVIKAAWFKIFGVSFVSARAMNVFFACSTITITDILVRKLNGRIAAAITTLLLSANFFYFSLSRLALLETPMTFFMILSVLLMCIKRPAALMVMLSALASVSAVLVKTTAIFTFPVLAYLLLTRNEAFRKKILFAGLYTVVCIICFGAWYLCLVKPHYADFAYFNQLNIGSKMKWAEKDIVHWLQSFLQTAQQISKYLFPAAFLISAVLLTVKRFRKNRLVGMSVLWVVMFFVIIMAQHYFPPRYYVPLAIPVAILTGVIAQEVFSLKSTRGWILAQTVVVAGLAVYTWSNASSTIKYLSHPRYTLYNAAEDIKQISDKPGSGPVLADVATIDLSGMVIMNSLFATDSIETRIHTYHPEYFVTFNTKSKNEVEMMQVLRKYYNFRLLKSYDVMGNYYTGQPVQLFQLIPKERKSTAID